MNLTGTWAVVESPDFDDEYLRMETEPYVKFRSIDGYPEGEYHIGLQKGHLSSEWEEPDRMIFTFDGRDEMDPVHGRAMARRVGDRLVFVLKYYRGDKFTFYCERKPRLKRSRTRRARAKKPGRPRR